MKSILNPVTTLLPALFVLLCISASCSKPSVNSGTFTWTYNGTQYEALQSRAELEPNGIFYITAATATISHPEVRITLSSPNKGQYTVGTNPAITVAFLNETTGNFDQSASGIINITSSPGNNVSGNFSVLLGDPVSGRPLTGSFSKVYRP